VIVGVGGITGDGKADLVSRDSAGTARGRSGAHAHRHRLAGLQGPLPGIVFENGSFPEEERREFDRRFVGSGGFLVLVAMQQRPQDVRAVLEGLDRDAARDVFWRLRLAQPQITRVCADRGYAGDRRGRGSHFST
jgi:hypothetical protein